MATGTGFTVTARTVAHRNAPAQFGGPSHRLGEEMMTMGR